MSRIRRVRRPVGLLLLPLALVAPLAGCYSTVPVTTGSADATTAGRALRVQLTPGGTQRMADTFGPYIVALDGTVEPGARSDSLIFRVTRTHHESGLDETRRGDVVRLAAADIASVQRRTRSVARTALLVAAVGGALALIPRIVDATSGGSGPQSPGGPVASRGPAHP